MLDEILSCLKDNPIKTFLFIITILLLPKRLKELYSYYLESNKFIENGNFGKNILFKDIDKTLPIGSYSIYANIVRDKNIIVKIIGSKDLSWSFKPNSWRYRDFNSEENSRELFTTSNQIYDTEISLRDAGLLTIEILDKKTLKLIRKNSINIINKLE